VWLEVDGRLGDVPGEDIWWDGDPPRRDLGELVCLLVLPAGHVVELDAIELVLEGSHRLAVRVHLVIVAARVFHDLVNHELRVPPHVEALDACFNGDFEAAEQGLVLGHII
jgi:predicted histidine transporter YuiF (NhaC family)